MCHVGASVSIVPFKSSETISFSERFTASENFDTVFKDGMGLVERTAAYLDGIGRRESKSLTPALAVVYANESMRLTTRLLEIASWLLVRRSLSSGEISPEDARLRRRCIRLGSIGRPAHVKGFADLPSTLQALIEESFSLNDRIVRLDKALEASSETRAADPLLNPVAAQIHRLEQAFTAHH